MHVAFEDGESTVTKIFKDRKHRKGIEVGSVQKTNTCFQEFANRDSHLIRMFNQERNCFYVNLFEFYTFKFQEFYFSIKTCTYWHCMIAVTS